MKIDRNPAAFPAIKKNTIDNICINCSTRSLNDYPFRGNMHCNYCGASWIVKRNCVSDIFVPAKKF